ncbi:organic cation transporter protein-like [Ylistrum balloti]|uniref:organic cation transporter protein-like n=1 Tax=Ylistrum balloti TaxID=509963 RepID=UPI002905811F|nr:organic cation transporter protein-like [Ylistrum balloti]
MSFSLYYLCAVVRKQRTGISSFARNTTFRGRIKMDKILIQIGEFGWYQKFVYFLICWSTLFSGLYEMMSVVLLNTPEHRCKVPGLENDTYDIHSTYQQNLVNNYIPPSVDESQNYDRCHLYAFDYNDVKFDNSGRPINATLVKCDKWVYSDSVMKESLSTKLDIVCDDTYLIPLVKSLYIVGKFIGAFVFGNLSDAIGRKTTLCVALMAMFGLTFGMSWSSSYIVFAVIITAIGVTTQGVFPIGFVLGVELVGPSKRKYTGLVAEYFFSIGLVILAGVSFLVRDWFIINIICSAHAALFIFYWWLIPESPRWLISKKRYQDAYTVLQKIARSNKVTIDHKILEEEMTTEASEPVGRVWQLFSKSMLARTLIILFNWCIVSMIYYGLSLNAGNLGGDFYLNMSLSGLVEIPANAMVLLLVDRVGRKKIYCICMIFGGCACAATILPIVYNETENEVIITTLAMIGKFGTSAAYGTMYLYSVELFPTVVRNAGLGASICAGRIGGIVAPYIADSAALISGLVGKIFPLGMFGLLSIIAGLSSLYLPETLNKTLPETMEDSKLLGKSAYMSLGDNDSKEDKNHFYYNKGYRSEKGNTNL